MSHRMLLTTLAAAAVLASGCAPTSPVFDQNFAQSTRVLRAQQVVNANAPVANQSRTVEGLDGRAAREVMERYQRSFIEPQRATNIFNIGVGGGVDTAGPAGR